MNIAELFQTSYRALISLVVLYLVTKMIGKKQVSQLSLFDYVIGISIGNFAAEMTINLESNELNGIWAVILFGLFAYLISILTMKSIWLRRFFMGTPTILIQEGKILESNLKKVKFDINDIIRQYNDKIRYPFNCDFYIKSLDLFIECNYFWTHHNHYYNENDTTDKIELKRMVNLSNTHKFYKCAITVWTKTDLLKRDTAINNKLNYIVFWNYTEFEKWYNDLNF